LDGNKLFIEGKKNKDYVILLLVALNDRQMRIEVGYGLEGALPDATSNQIITKTLRPAFQSNDYYQGINQALDQIILATKGEYKAEPISASKFKFPRVNLEALFWLGVLIFYLLGALWRHLAKSQA
jgi:uncharacterized protein